MISAVLFLTFSNSPECWGDLPLQCWGEFFVLFILTRKAKNLKSLDAIKNSQTTARVLFKHMNYIVQVQHIDVNDRWMTTCFSAMKVTVVFWSICAIFPFFFNCFASRAQSNWRACSHGHTGRLPLHPIYLLIKSNWGEKRNVIIEDNKWSRIARLWSSVTIFFNR